MRFQPFIMSTTIQRLTRSGRAEAEAEAYVKKIDCRNSTPADAIDRTAAIHRSARPHPNTGGADANTRHGPRYQHDAGSCHAANGIRHVLAVHHGAGLFCTRGQKPCDHQGSS
jgi:hypothetical protein